MKMLISILALAACLAMAASCRRAQIPLYGELKHRNEQLEEENAKLRSTIGGLRQEIGLADNHLYGLDGDCSTASAVDQTHLWLKKAYEQASKVEDGKKQHEGVPGPEQAGEKQE
jgi:hypothetical protein